MNKILCVALLCATLFAACKKDNTKQPETTTNNKIKIAEEATASGIEVTLWSDVQPLKTGYNKVYVSLDHSGKSLTDATVSYMPVMNMTSMQHSCPVEQPVFNSKSNLYEGAIVFTMPSDSMMMWHLKVTVNNETVDFNLKVTNTANQLVGTYMGADGESYVVALIPPKSWEVGLNDFELLVNRADGMMAYPPDDHFEITFLPEMPSMGHSSPNNTNPVSVGNGHYKGQANLTMTGDWRFHFKLNKNETLIIPDAYMDISF